MAEAFEQGARGLLSRPRTTPEALADTAYHLGTADVLVVDRTLGGGLIGKHARHVAEMQPHVKLTPQELNVLQQLASGLNDQEVARALGIKRTTVETHISNLRQKLPVSNRVQMGIYAACKGLIDGLADYRN